MNRCILCGNLLEFCDYDLKTTPTSVKCTACKKIWKLVEHENDDEWCIKEINKLKEAMDKLLKKLGV